jgi:hypothetical protein
MALTGSAVRAIGLFGAGSVLWQSCRVTRRLTPPERYAFRASLAALQAPNGDPCVRVTASELWMAARTPDGPGTLHLALTAGAVEATAYGPGQAWLEERADAIAGLRDDVSDFPALARAHPLVHQLARTFSGLRMPATGLVFHRVLRAILEQKVTGVEAFRAYRKICRKFGEPAPGPVDLLLPPDPAAIAASAYWEFHPLGVEQRRTQALLRAAREAGRIERGGLPRAQHGRLGAGRRGPRHRRADAGAARAVPRSPRPGLRSAGPRRHRGAPLRAAHADPVICEVLRRVPVSVSVSLWVR